MRPSPPSLSRLSSGLHWANCAAPDHRPVLGLAPVGRVAGEVPERQQELGPEGEPVGGRQGGKPQREASPAGGGSWACPKENA